MKRLYAVMLSGLLVASSVPMNSTASELDATMDISPIAIKAEDPASSKVEPTEKGLEEVIKAIKSKITVPSEYSEFDYYFYNSGTYTNAFWYLTWRIPNENSYIQVNCDANSHITYFYHYDNAKDKEGVVKYLKSELKETAEKFITKLEPQAVGRLKLLSSEYEGSYSGNYAFHYQRVENGVPFPENTIDIQVNSISGEVSGATVNWIYGVSIPSKETKLTLEEATKLIKENMKMKLVYRSDYYNIYKEGGYEPQKAFLVYEPSERYISVDAKTGDVYLKKSEWVDTGADYTNEKEEAATDSASGAASRALTEEEIAKIKELNGLISKSNAIKKVTSNSYLYLDSNLKSYSATLSKTVNASGDASYVWNVELNDPREINYETDTDLYRAYAYAVVDAKTGKILSYHASVKNYYDEKNQKWETVKIPYSKESGKVTLEKFLNSQIENRFKNSVFTSQNDDYVVYYTKDNTPVYGGYSYQYNRVNEGIEYPYNSIYGSVDGVTGKIYSYSSNWNDDVVFESPKGIISADKALDFYLGKEGYGLQYEINVINKLDTKYPMTKEYYDLSDAYSVEYEIRLVYHPEVNPYYISPFTGEQLENSGEVYKKDAAYTYKDIDSIDNRHNILLLSDMNIGFEGDYFLPEKEITQGELIAILNKVGFGYVGATDESSKNEPITKEEAAQAIIDLLGMKKVSALEGIYKTGYADEEMISKKYLGAVAIAKGLGLMDAASENYFKPQDNVTRSEAVDLIMNFITVQKKGIYN